MPLVDLSILDGILCESHERTVANDNCVSFEGMALQIPAHSHRPTYRKIHVSVKRHLDGALSICHGPRKLSQYDKHGRLTQHKTSKKRASKSRVRKPEKLL